MTHSGSPLLDLYLSYDQWKDEHDALRDKLKQLCVKMRWNPGNFDYPYWGTHLRQVHDDFMPFMAEWRTHLATERKIVYPIAKNAGCGGRMGQATVLEQEDRIAMQFYESYLESLANGEPAAESLSRLLQVLFIISERFRVEDETIVPAAERLMDEIEYIRS